MAGGNALLLSCTGIPRRQIIARDEDEGNMKKWVMAIAMAAVTCCAFAEGLFTVTQYNLKEQVATVSEAKAAIRSSSHWSGSPVTRRYSQIAFEHGLPSTRPAHFRGAMVSFPGSTGGYDMLVLKIVGTIALPEAGEWTFACGSDDGFEMKISGNGISRSFYCKNRRAFSTTCETISIPTAGEYAVSIVYFNYVSIHSDGVISDAAAIEVSYAKGDYSSVTSAFSLLRASTMASSYCVNFDDNGGSGEMPDQVFKIGETKRLCKNQYLKTGYVFQGWAKTVERATNGLVDYKDEAEVSVDSDMTLYAVWANPALALMAESADWSSGSITLRCEDADTSGAAHKYSLEYCDESGAWVAVGGAGAANVFVGADGFAHLTDGGFCSRLDGIKTVSYRVKDENGRVSEPCVTRNRYGLSVGFNKYGTKAKPLDQSLADARLFQNLALSKGRFSRVELLKNGDATTGGIHDAFVRWADVVKPGDAFAFFIATHGGFNGSRAGLSAYNGLYPVSSLVDDSSLLPVGSLFVGVVMSCHSRAMVDYSDTDPTKFQYQVRNGLAQCRVNSAWISSCGYDESSYNSPSSSQSAFGEWFLEKGWQGGFADAILNGLDYGGGNGNGKLTLLEVAKYTHAFYKGNSDSKPSEVYWDTANNDLLGAFVLDASCRPQSMTAPSMPTGVTASQGDTKIGISWTASGNATSYRIYRYPLDSPGEFKWIGISGGSRFPDDTATLKKEYGYRIKAVNPVGMSDFSSAAIGSRGTSKFIEFLDSFFGITTASAEEYDTMEKTLAANGCRTVGECYALGIDPEDPNDDFRIANFEMKDGKPVITLNHTEDGSGNSFATRIRTLGAKELGAAAQWDDVTDLQDYGAEQGYRFFKVDVELP